MVIDDLRRKFKVSLSFILKAVKLPRSNYYYATSSQSIDKDKNIIKLINSIKEINPNYGYRRVTMALNNDGYNVNHKRVLRIMKKCGGKDHGKIHHNSTYRLDYHIDSVITFCNSFCIKK